MPATVDGGQARAACMRGRWGLLWRSVLARVGPDGTCHWDILPAGLRPVMCVDEGGSLLCEFRVCERPEKYLVTSQR